MIISASRRTDIPALYGEWFMNRVRAGWCAVPNPMNARRVSHVSLQPGEVDAIVFWSKDPAPLLPHLDELDSMGFRYYFLFTLNDYPGKLEPNVPSLDERLETFLDLSRCTGPLRVVWRYDPIIISNVTTFDYHAERFARIAAELKGATRRVVVSFVDYYRKTERRLGGLEREGFEFDRQAESSEHVPAFLKELASIARKRDMEMFTCAEDRDYAECGVPPGRCIDDQLMNKLWPLQLGYKKDPYQRDLCLCAVSKDIGVSDTCTQGCTYCYSTVSNEVARRRCEQHDPTSPALWGRSAPDDEPVESHPRQMRLLK